MLAATAVLAVFSTRSPKTCRTWAAGLSGLICSPSPSLGLSRRSCWPQARAVIMAEEASHWSDGRAMFASGLARVSQPPEIGALIRSRIYRAVYAG
jgi:hypothetical protein